MQILLDLVSEHAASLLVVQCTVPLLGAFFSQAVNGPLLINACMVVPRTGSQTFLATVFSVTLAITPVASRNLAPGYGQAITEGQAFGERVPHDFADNVEVVWVGIPREPDDFLAKAVLAGHPKALLDSEPDPHMLMLIDNLLEGSVDSPQKGRAELDRWKALKASFNEQQDSVRKDWDPHVREVLGDKSTVLLDFLLKEIDFPDHRLVKHMTQGFRLSGWVCRTGLFPFDPKPPSSTIASQLKTAKARNVATLSAISKQADDEISEKAWAETIEESRKGWIFEDETPELDKILIAHRVPEKYRLHGVEFIAAFLLLAMRDPRIGVKDAEQGKARIFGTNSLPFGATGAKSLGIAWTNYFDDFPMFAKAESSDTTDSLAADFLDLFSILFAREGKKATSFDQTFRALGLLFDLSRFEEGEVTIGHTKERGEELKATISAILAADCLSHAEAESLRGRLHWYTSFLFGRRSSQALNVVSDWVNRGVSSGRLSEDLKDALKYLKDVALDAPPFENLKNASMIAFASAIWITKLLVEPS
ncbi:unnamed protein product, partial [Symbiodinium microadriaticum]